jgi:DNA modification methylase
VKIHEVCAIFPMMSVEEFSGLKEDIAVNGQREPVWTYRGEVIDGRNRLKACEELRVTPKVKEWDGKGSLVEFVVSLNLHRRHLTSSQKAACGTDIEERLAVEAKERQRASGGDKRSKDAKKSVVAKLPQPIEAKPKSRDKAAKIVGSSPRNIQDAKTVKKKAPKLHEEVKAGKKTISQAKREIARSEKRADLETKAKAVEAQPQPEKPTWEIVEGDCNEFFGKIKVPTVRPRLIFADPPYNIGVDYGNHYNDKMKPDEYINWCKEWIIGCVCHLTPDGSMWVLINDEWADVFGCLLRDAGLYRRAWIKWYESFGVNVANNFNRTSRHLFYMVKDPKRFVFNPEAVSRPSDRQLKYNDKRADPGGKIWDDVWGINPPIPRLVENAKERLPDFPTQLPLALLRAVVGCASEPGDLVCDPFNGSGTTGVAAIELGRRYVGIEQSAEFAKWSRMRLSTAKGCVSP